jgi:hypothetical protein
VRGRRTVRSRCRRHLDGITIPQPFSLDVLCAQVAVSRQRPLHLRPLPQPTDPGLPTGLWLNGETADYVFYDGRTSELHKRHIVLHEIGHMLFGYDDKGLEDNDVLFRGPQDPVRADLIRRIHARRRYSSAQEREAEMMATMFLEAIGSLPPPSPLAGFAGRIAGAVGYTGRR